MTETLRPQQDCPGVRCKTGKRCVPTKRRCDKYVDCMNAEDERDCDYTGSQYHPNLYRSRNTDHSNLKYSQSKRVAEDGKTEVLGNVTAAYRRATMTTPPTYAEPAVYADAKSNRTNTTAARLNDTVFNALLRQLFDNQFTENTFSCRRYSTTVDGRQCIFFPGRLRPIATMNITVFGPIGYRITQVVLANHRCDGTVDCEDGTDEEACDCKTRLANMYNSSAVCDGVADCHGGEDETACGRPNKCVKTRAWCNGCTDCDGDGEDEKYCSTDPDDF